jgi:hypothetical protein
LLRFLVLFAANMEANHGSVVVTLGYGALKCAGEALAALLLSALLKTQLFAPVTHCLLILDISLFIWIKKKEKGILFSTVLCVTVS